MSDKLKLIGLNPIVKCLVIIGLTLCKMQGVNAYVVEGKRSLKRQKELYGKGRTISECKRMMNTSDAIKYARPNEKKVTWTLNSNHIKGLAVDIVPYQIIKGNKVLIWNVNSKEFLKIANIFKSIGFKWGGDWRTSKDYPHYEIPSIDKSWRVMTKNQYSQVILSAVQIRLKNRGFHHGKTDGVYTALTEASIKKFKKSHGLKNNGVITKTFLRKLYLE